MNINTNFSPSKISIAFRRLYERFFFSETRSETNVEVYVVIKQKLCFSKQGLMNLDGEIDTKI
jgi:hypothetical protein